MSLKLNVPTLKNSESAQDITEAIAAVDPTAKVKVDVKSRTVTVDAADANTPVASEESIKQAITASGHSIKD
ncbi:MAG: cation transporter [Coleofasciculus sp. S288]|nr:cation transporter [Coleofasciculus sp. S288]